MRKKGQPCISIFRRCVLGDAVQMSPVLQQIRLDRPDAWIRLFISENVASLWHDAPYLDEIVPLHEGKPSRHGKKPSWLWGWLKAAWSSRSEILLSLEPTLKRNLGLWLCRSTRKGGYLFDGLKPLHPFTHPIIVPGDPGKATMHTSEMYLRAWSLVSGFPDRGLGYDMHHLKSEPVPGCNLSRPYVCLAPGAGNAWLEMKTKRWPAEYYAELACLLMHQGYDVVFLGGRLDMHGVALPAGVHDFLGKTTIPQVVGLLRGAAAMLGNDSGLMHLAVGVSCPVVAVFGPTGELFTGPFRAQQAEVLRVSLPCTPCYAMHCHPPDGVVGDDPHRPYCMYQVPPERALRALLKQVSGNGSLSPGQEGHSCASLESNVL